MAEWSNKRKSFLYLMSNSLAIPIIIVAQFCCTCIWFAGNAVIQDLGFANQLEGDHLVLWTVMVQLGFIIGTFLTAFLLLADRFPPANVFLFAGLVGGILNLGLLLPGQSTVSISILRFLSGLTLAGIYPIGMKIAADYRREGLGMVLGFLVGALVLGTAFPHLLKNMLMNTSWKWVIIGISILSFFGAFLVYLFVPDGPFRKPQTKFRPNTFLQGFKLRKFRAAAFGYFGHMWELYAFWTLIPGIIGYYFVLHNRLDHEISLLSFLIIAMGAVGCVIGGYLAKRWNSQLLSTLFLLGSLICCLFSPFMYQLSFSQFVLFLLIWGFLVAGDSPQFSTLIANNVAPENKGTSLTIVNGIGFSITIFALSFIGNIENLVDYRYILLFLSIGPFLGILAMLNTFFINKKEATS